VTGPCFTSTGNRCAPVRIGPTERCSPKGATRFTFTGGLRRQARPHQFASRVLFRRFETEDGDATALRPLGDNVIVNMSVWKDVESLHAYVYPSDHAQIISRRNEWFQRMKEAYTVLRWVPQELRPGVDEALDRKARAARSGLHFPSGVPTSRRWGGRRARGVAGVLSIKLTAIEGTGAWAPLRRWITTR
jgi:hypothetical protein